MSKTAGLWIEVGEALSEAVAAGIENNSQFTTAVSYSRVRPRAAELVVVSMYGTAVDYIGISQAGRRIATGQRMIMVSKLVAIKSLTIRKVEERLPNRFKGQVFPREAIYRPTPRLWEEIIKVIASERPEVGARIAGLRRAIAEARFPRGRREGGLEVFERDAVVSALQAWGGPSLRKKILRGAVPHGDTPVASFLSQLQGVSLREDPLIIHDNATFPGMNIARRDIVGSVVLSDGAEYLTILNCNRQPLEQTLGVDLIYYNHRFDSFVLVQYKRMTQVSVQPEYRPQSDPSHAKELQRMVKTDKMLSALSTNSTSTKSFRLSGRPFYMKLCEPKANSALDAGMVSGMYVPLDLWQRLLKSPAVLGPRGGISITWENCARRLTNTEFTNLLRHGWIGSSARESKSLARIIEGVLGNRRMLVLAASSANRNSNDFRRDPEGRFAASDDPFATF